MSDISSVWICISLITKLLNIFSYAYLPLMHPLQRSFYFAVLSHFGRVWLFVTSMDYSLPSLSVHAVFQAKTWSGLTFPPLGDLPNRGIEPVSLSSPALAGRYFTTITTFIFLVKTVFIIQFQSGWDEEGISRTKQFSDTSMVSCSSKQI